MDNNKKHRCSPISNISIGKKVLFMDGMVIAVLVIIALAMFRAVSDSQNDKYKEMERTAVTATEQIMNMSVENTVSIAKNIYTNEALYDFLNKRYSSSSEYYEAYYPLQQNTAMNIADTNLVNSCLIYTANDTVLEGGSVCKLDSAKNDYWYQTFQKLNKATILCIDPHSGAMIMVRKLDYQHLDTGESYLCLEMNNNALVKFVDNLGFDGELYVMSGGKLLYTSGDKNDEAEDVVISPDFECIARNYYTVDVEFYSCASRKGVISIITGDKRLIISFIVVFVLVLFASLAVYISVRRRIKNAVKEFRESGNFDALENGSNGRDEIGQLLDICCEMSAGMMQKGDESRINSDFLQQKESEYNSLFSTAMRLEAELAVGNSLPELKGWSAAEYISVALETDLVHKVAEKHGSEYSSEAEMPIEWKVPAYSLVLITDDLFRNYGKGSVKITPAEKGIEIAFECERASRSTDALKLNAIFEDEGIAEEYSFDRHNRFNPYLRLKHCLGNNAYVNVSNKNYFSMTIKLSFPDT